MLRQLGYGRQPLAWLPFPGATPPTQVVFAARDLGGARDIAAVLDARIRARTGQPVPQPQGPWAGRVPQLPDPERRAYLAGIAALMDDRTRRLGQHTTRTAPAWAVAALRPVPGDTAARRDWERKSVPDRRLPGDIRIRPPRRPDRPRARS